MGLSEHWANSPDYEHYQVSDQGRIYSLTTGTILRPSMNTTGSLKVNLMLEGRVVTRSVRVMVADVYVPHKSLYDHPTPINLDGDPWNNYKENLMWRPRWFAWKYARQFTDFKPSEFYTTVLELETGIIYESVIQAGIASGVLWDNVFNSLLTGKPVYPTGSTYSFV